MPWYPGIPGRVCVYHRLSGYRQGQEAAKEGTALLKSCLPFSYARFRRSPVD